MADSEIGVVRLVGGTALTPHQLIRDMSLAISNGRIVSLSGRVPISGGDVPSHEETPSLPQTRAGQDTLPSQEPHGGFNESITIDTKGMTILPGLINIHDHLLGTWHSKIGGGPYPNVYRWLKAVEYHPLRIECKKNTEEDIYLLGAYKNLFSGVTTVLDHYIRYDPDFYQALPLRVIHEFGRTWTLREETGWGGTIEEEFSRTNGRQPYVIHIAEGVDGEARSELAALERRGALARNTVLVHAIALSDHHRGLVPGIEHLSLRCDGQPPGAPLIRRQRRDRNRFLLVRKCEPAGGDPVCAALCGGGIRSPARRPDDPLHGDDQCCNRTSEEWRDRRPRPGLSRGHPRPRGRGIGSVPARRQGESRRHRSAAPRRTSRPRVHTP